MKKIGLISFLFIATCSLKAQTGASNIKFMIDLSHYTVANTYDSTFVKYLQFDLGDTATVSKLGFTLTNINPGNKIQKQYTLASGTTAQDLTVASNWQRIKNHVKFSLGYFKYLGNSYQLTITQYDSGGNVLNTANYNFNH